MNYRVLVLDDEKEAVEGYVSFLKGEEKKKMRSSSRMKIENSENSEIKRFEVFSAYTGEEALSIVESQLKKNEPIAAGFFDVKLGAGMDGLSTLKEVWKKDPRLHAAIVTAYHDRSIDEIDKLFDSKLQDQWDYLNKPFTQAEIVQKARQMTSAWNREIQLRKTQEQLIQSEKMAAIGQVARGIGHEFGNILLRIMGKADLALMSNDSEKIKKHLEVILQASETAGYIVQNLQSFSKVNHDKKMLSIHEPLEQCLLLIQHEFVKNKIELKKQFDAKTPLKIDGNQVAQVFMNLLINAIHAMTEGGVLSIHTQENEKEVQIEVKDTGKGILAEIQPYIFDYAYSTKGERGSGLGLSISKELVEAHGGSLILQKSDSTGSCFLVSFPKGDRYE
ncbi:MAG: hypothetical protein CL678_16575 [Bdellovibrionaceae bacterium]|nr:hypothetical protein [Pseudobdellovibrionaceae bacterium]|tara:strand:- start:2898 stop:4070 length:1173 start_codon:yes stop_codon:yes gene_type:complete